MKKSKELKRQKRQKRHQNQKRHQSKKKGKRNKKDLHVTIVLEEDSSKFKPVFYTFRRTDSKNVARGPPFWVLTDHLIAVIWHLFKDPPSEEPIGISQLQWALEFLRNIRDDTGEYPEYVKASICGLEDRLLELYACVPSFTGEEEDDGGDEEGEGGEEEGREEGEEEQEGGEEEGAEEAAEEAKEDEEEEEDDDDRPRKGSIIVSGDDMVDRPSESMLKRMSIRQSAKIREDEMKALNCSFTLKDILTKAPKKIPKDPELQNLLTRCPSGPSVTQSASTSQTRMGGSQTKIEGAARSDMMRFLNSLRKEQTDRISIELKQLEKINEYLKEVESGKINYSALQGLKETKSTGSKKG